MKTFVSRGRYLDYSPYKLRPLADVIRGKGVAYAMAFLSTYRNQRSETIRKVVASGIANAASSLKKDVKAEGLFVKEIRIDQGPIRRYFKPGAQGRAMPQRKRLCHITVILESTDKGL